MFTICDLQLEPGRFHYITDLKFLSHASVTTLYSINLGHGCSDLTSQPRWPHLVWPGGDVKVSAVSLLSPPGIHT